MRRILGILHKCLIMRELLPPIAVCSIDKHFYSPYFFTLSRMSFAHRGRAFLCLCVLLTSFFFVSCEHYEDFDHGVMQAFLEESQGLKQVPLDSIRRFSAKVDKWVIMRPEAKNDPIYSEIEENIHQAMVTFKLEVDDSWDDDIFIKFGFSSSE